MIGSPMIKPLSTTTRRMANEMKNWVRHAVRRLTRRDAWCVKLSVECAPQTKITGFLAALFSLSMFPLAIAAQSPTAVSDNTKPNLKALDPVQLALGVDVER